MEIESSLKTRIPSNRLADTSTADALLQLNLSDVRFTRTAFGKYVWTLKSTMVAMWNHKIHHLRYGYKLYEYTSLALPLDDGVQNEGEALNEGLDACVEGLAEQMAEDIWFKNPGKGL
jgi:hypothetical protein